MIKGLSAKYGYERAKELDFSDDGNKFLCYKYRDYRVSYLQRNGEYYISPYIDSQKLQYSELCQLPHYRDLQMLNGQYNVTEDDTLALALIIDMVIDEIRAAESRIQPEAEINCAFNDRMVEEYKYKLAAYNETIEKLNAVPFEKICGLSNFDYSHLREYVAEAKAELSRAINARNEHYSIAAKRQILERSIESTCRSYWLEQINKIIEHLAQK